MERPVRSSWLELVDKSNIKLGAFPQHQKGPFGARGFKQTHRAHLQYGGAGEKYECIYFQAVSFYGSFTSESCPRTPFYLNVMLKNITRKKKKKVTSLRGKNPARELCVLVHVLYQYNNHICLMFPLGKVSDIFNHITEVFMLSYGPSDTAKVHCKGK